MHWTWLLVEYQVIKLILRMPTIRALPNKYHFDIIMPESHTSEDPSATRRKLFEWVIVENKINNHGPVFTFSRFENHAEFIGIEDAPKFDFSTVPGYKRPRRVERSYDVFELIEK